MNPFDRDNWTEIFAALKANRIRTLMTVFGVFWGIFMLVIMLGCGRGLRNGITSDFAGSATNSFFIWAQNTSKPYKGFKPGRSFDFRNADIAALRELDFLSVVAPMNQLGDYGNSSGVVRGINSSNLRIMGVYPEIQTIQNLRTKEGRFINLFDLLEKRKVVVIGKRAVEALYKPAEKIIGTYLRIAGVYFQVVGVTESSASGQDNEEQTSSVYLPFSTFQAAFNYGDAVGWFSIIAKDGIAAADAESRVIDLMKRRHTIAPDDRTAIGHWNMGKEFDKLQGLFLGIEGLIWFVGIGTLLAGVIGVSNIMLIVVRERTSEIGVKRAVGATPSSIILQIMLEALFITMFSGYLGMVLGIVILDLVASEVATGESSMFTNPSVDISIALKALFVLILAGLFAGFLPARKAASIQPVDALRS